MRMIMITKSAATLAASIRATGIRRLLKTNKSIWSPDNRSRNRGRPWLNRFISKAASNNKCFWIR